MNDKIPNKKLEERVVFGYDHASAAATTTIKLWKCPAGRSFVLDRVSYINPTGLTGDNTNAFSGELKNGATQMSLVFNTDTNDVPAGISLVANTFVEGAVVAGAAAWLAAGDVMSLVLTMDGSQTLPAGRFMIEGRLL